MNGITDIHCHILPGLDDGAKGITAMETILKKASDEGIRQMIATSHYNPQMFAYSREDYETSLATARSAAAKLQNPIAIYPGHEVFYTGEDAIQALDAGEALTLAGSDYVLVEFAGHVPFEHMKQSVSYLLQRGYIPILAHVERYDCLHQNVKGIEGLIDLGAYIQMNAHFITDRHSFGMKRFLHTLFKRGDIHFIATDAHSVKNRPADIRDCVRYIEKKVGSETADRIFSENPNAVIRNRLIQ